MNETELQTRLRRAKEALDHAREVENMQRKALAAAVESTRRAKEKWEELVYAEENAEVARRKANYRHVTK